MLERVQILMWSLYCIWTAIRWSTLLINHFTTCQNSTLGLQLIHRTGSLGPKWSYLVWPTTHMNKWYQGCQDPNMAENVGKASFFKINFFFFLIEKLWQQDHQFHTQLDWICLVYMIKVHVKKQFIDKKLTKMTKRQCF